jgi:signal transduction protein with GAF and PtsI domain
MKQLTVDAAAVLLHQPQLHTLEYAAWRGFNTRLLESIHLRLGESFAGRAALEHCAIQVTKPAHAQENIHVAALWEGEGFAAYFAAPLIVQGEIKGVLDVAQRAPLDANSGWLDFLNTLAAQAAIAIAHVQLFDG